MSKRHTNISFKDAEYTLTDLQSETGTWKKILSYYGEPVCNAVYKIGDTVFTCYKGPAIEFIDEWLQKHGLLHLWDAFCTSKIGDMEAVKVAASKGFVGIPLETEAERETLKKAAKNFERDYYEGCTKYRIVLQFIEGPMKGIETEVGLRGLTFGGNEDAEVNVFTSLNPDIKGCAKIVYQNGHYFLMNSDESSRLSFYKCCLFLIAA